MRSKLFLILVIITCSFFIGKEIPALNNSSTMTNSSKMNQQEIKTNLEIDKLKADIKNSNFAIKYQLGTTACTAMTAIIAVLTMFFSTKNQNKTYIMQMKENKKQQISNYLAQISNGDQAIKIGAIQALGNYEEATPFIINILKREEDYFVVNAVGIALLKNANICIKLLVGESNLIKTERIKVAGELVALGESKNDICNYLYIDEKEYKKWNEDNLLEGAKDQLINKIEMQLKITGLTKEELISNEKKNILIKLYSMQNLLKEILIIMPKAMKIATQSGREYSIERAYLPGIQLNDVDLSNWNFSEVNLTGATFKKCRFDNTNLENAILNYTSFRECYFNKNIFKGEFYNSCDFSKCIMDQVTFNHINAQHISFKGAELKECKFEECECIEPKMEGTKFYKVNFKNTKLFKANFMNAEINYKNIFSEVNFSGSRFDGSKNIGTKFNDCKMFGVRLDNASYKKCSLINVDFKDIEKYDNSRFKSNKYNNVGFLGGITEFKQHVEEQNGNGI
ncbi:pentapeptide repeat-containing protein [Clostridium estertheticum]|uniref:pentapeptide repeat-containing protein n=1 Tax=Clostridium estertheticum TaxID=238834 RepID=UPI001C0C1BCF|nr:pentapeptide repeat-containing protein [Clostridium estertheticum]MBU3202214.1 pentapeptide repeat-containing protein [Clostridium estertheticum]WAG67899.1 pentapeptide repeat-containing protein [Clostridium estertheticum]